MSAQEPLLGVNKRRQGISTRTVIRVSMAGSAFVAVLYLYFYTRTHAWQVLTVSLLAMASLLSLAWASRLLKTGRDDLCGHVLLITILFTYGGSELVLKGVTPYLLSGIPLIVLVGWVVLPGQWVAWLRASASLAGWIALVNWLEPLPRYEAFQATPAQPIFILGVSITVSAFVLWQIVRALRVGSIRTRLIISFAILVVLPVAVSTLVSSILNADNARRQVFAQLQSVAVLKATEIEGWLRELQDSLLITSIYEEDRVRMRRLLKTETMLPVRQEAYGRLKARFSDIISQVSGFKELFVMDATGTVILSTDNAHEGLAFGESELLRQGLEGPYTSPPTDEFSPGEISILVARPILNPEGETLGVLVGRAGLTALDQIMLESSGLGETGETYLVSSDYMLLTPSRFEGYEPLKSRVHTLGVNSALNDNIDSYAVYVNYRNVPVLGVYRWIPDLQAALMAEQEQSEAIRSSNQILLTNIGLSVLALAVALAASLWVTRGITGPLHQLARVAGRITQGDLELEAPVERQDEIGALATAFNSMTAQLRSLIGTLEERVAERTRDLEQRTRYMEAAAEVGRAAATILDADRLARQVVELVRQRFDLYYVGLFRLDETHQWAVLHAGTGEAGRAMLERGHRIQVGEGMIGWSIAHGQARVASQAEADAVRLSTPELPLTRSEAALPLRSRGQVLGALTVQSAQPNAFTPDMLTVLQTVADQVAVALDNARLFGEAQAAIEAQRRAFGELGTQAWRQLLQARPAIGYRRTSKGRMPITQPPPLEADDHQLSFAIQVRGQTIGHLVARRPPDMPPWSEEEKDTLGVLVEQLGLVLEDAQLFYESQRAAQREQFQRQIIEQVRAAPDVQTIAQTAVEELTKALNAGRAFIKFTVNGEETT